MKIVTMYQSEKDYKMFSSERECLEHDQLSDDVDAANDMLHNGATLMASLTRAFRSKPLWDSNLKLEDKVILMKMTKDTKLKIPHWQCCDAPVYSACRINMDYTVFFCGTGSWSGWYGNNMELSDYLRHAHNTDQDFPLKTHADVVEDNA